jgi:hypothetical protein
LYCPVSSDESQIKEVSIDLFEHFDFSPEKIKTLQGNDPLCDVISPVCPETYGKQGCFIST